ncbi:hypothetical protein [Pseudomonas simiae]|uniref:hypothetical protein n=1 Tax=Pseudomonas simiae TaxID=321846 RepID=UPI003D6C011F
MSEVERYWINPSRLVQEGWHQDDTCVVKDWAYDRVVAERDALQQLLTAADELADLLLGLLREARQHHGVMLMSDPPQDAWKYHRMNERIDAVLNANSR